MVDYRSQLDDALQAFAGQGALVERAQLAPILATSGAAAAAKDPRFDLGMRRVVDTLRMGHAESLETLAFAWRATSVTSMREYRKYLIQALASGVLPQEFGALPTRMQDPEDRRHFADAIQHVVAPWKANYVARAIAAEREGEKARESLCRALLSSLPVLADEIALVGDALAAELFEQHEPEVGRARRATAIMEAFASALWASDAEVEPGEGFGEALASLVSRILLRRPPSDRSVSQQFAAAVTNYVVVVARLHGSLAADARVYAFIAPMRRALGAGDWPGAVQAQMNRAAAQVLDQLLLLVRLQMPDAELRRAFVSMVGDAAAKRRFAIEAERGLDPELAHWLVTGAARRRLATQDALSETAQSTVDADLAQALRETELLKDGLRQVLPDLRSAAEFHSSALADRLTQVADRMERLASSVRNAAHKRGLVLRGTPGDVVDYSPAEHEPSAAAVGERTVRLINKGVERVVQGRPAGIILKADVDKA